MKKLLIFTLSLIVIIGSIYTWDQSTVRTVNTIRPVRDDIETIIRATGRVINDHTVTMTALVDGQITEMPVRMGDTVKLGQILTVLDHREAEVRYKKALAEHDKEKEAVKESSRKVKKLREVLKSGGTTAEAVIEAEAVERAANARLRVAQYSTKLEKIFGENLKVVAPFAGVITEKTTEVGQWVEAGTKLFTLVAREGREIQVNIDAGDSAVINLDQPVTLKSDTWGNMSWPERIVRLSPSVQTGVTEALNTFSVRISLGKESPPLLLNQQVDAFIQIEKKVNVLTLPFEALLESHESTSIATVSDAGKVELIEIETGLENLTHVEIISGLKGDEIVILTNGQEVQVGEIVNIREGNKQPILYE